MSYKVLKMLQYAAFYSLFVVEDYGRSIVAHSFIYLGRCFYLISFEHSIRILDYNTQHTISAVH